MPSFNFLNNIISFSSLHLFATVPDSRINSWESWFIFNLRKINTDQYYESVSLNAGNNSTICECMTLQDDNYIKLLYILELRPSWSCSGLKLSPILASPHEHASCCHTQPSILLFTATVQVSHLAPSAIWVASH
jgi:hypothetical protein